MDTAFVYCLEFPNGKRYVGVSSQPRVRLTQHASGPYPVGKAIRKYGLPVLKILVQASRKYCYSLESKLIRLWNTKDPEGYNLNEGGLGGIAPCEKSREKMKAWERTENWKQKIAEAKSGQVFSESHKQALSKAAKQRAPVSEETREKYRARKGWRHSEETKAKIRAKKLARDLEAISCGRTH